MLGVQAKHNCSSVNSKLPQESHVDDDLKDLLSKAALATSPLGAMYAPDGSRLRATTFKEVGAVVMGGAAFAGPLAEVVFLAGLGTWLAGAAFEP